MLRILGLVALIIGLYGGLRFPDIDQVTDLLLHRSIITHGPLLPLLAFTFASTTLALAARWFAIGVSLSFAVHLAFDLFPRAWLGYALISVPFYGWTPATFSWAWIAVSALLCTYLAFRLIRGFWDTTMLLFSLICVFAYAAISENPLWRPIAAMTIFTIAAGTLSVLTTRPHSSPDPY